MDELEWKEACKLNEDHAYVLNAQIFFQILSVFLKHLCTISLGQKPLFLVDVYIIRLNKLL